VGEDHGQDHGQGYREGHGDGHGEDGARRRAEAAMRAVPRAGFLPPEQRPLAAADRPLPIGFGQTSSQPSTVLRMLELLDVRPGCRVLDVGCGSCWTTALLSVLAGPGGTVVGVELEPELVQWGRANLAAAGWPQVPVHQADPDRLGRPDEAPFDRILVSAQAAEVPEALCAQLADPGTLVVPAGGHMHRVRLAGGRRTDETFGRYRFVPLR
jgi:protein-L-isoaspartate(D-aspartate) O-methyltransferase